MSQVQANDETASERERVIARRAEIGGAGLFRTPDGGFKLVLNDGYSGPDDVVASGDLDDIESFLDAYEGIVAEG